MKKAVRLLAIIGVVVAFTPTAIANLQGQAQYDLLIRHGQANTVAEEDQHVRHER